MFLTSTMKGRYENGMNTHWFLVLSCCAQVFFFRHSLDLWTVGSRDWDLKMEFGERQLSSLSAFEVSSTRIETLARYGICKGLFLRFRYGSLMRSNWSRGSICEKLE